MLENYMVELGAFAVMSFVAGVSVFLSALKQTLARRRKAQRELNLRQGARINALIWRWGKLDAAIYGRQ